MPAKVLMVQGAAFSVKGDIQVEKRIEIQPTGVLAGDITTPNPLIGDGAVFEGDSFMKKEQRKGKVLPLMRQGSITPQPEGRSSDP